MSQNDGMVPDDVLERLKKQIEWMKVETVHALSLLSRAENADEVHATLARAHQINADLIQLGKLVDWQVALRQAKRAQEDQVLQ